MPLGSPEDNVNWNDYKIDTPTFQLTPIEKPDMSLFLFHMTGKNNIKKILQSEQEGYGYLRANIPEAVKDLPNKSIPNYKARVVCFTESPTFALDFFRYRSYRRWKEDQRFGIGFDKEKLVVNHGIRPVLYLDKDLLQSVISLYNIFSKESNQFELENQETISKIVLSIKTIYPLLFPLMEDHEKQGFMWEREWRCTNPEGFYFSFDDIKVICCPEDEEQDIRDCLGDSVDKIEFVRAWDEYNDVTDYLSRQKFLLQQKQQKIEGAVDNQNPLEEYEDIKEIIKQYKGTLYTLEQSQTLLKKLQKWQQEINEKKSEVEQEIIAQERRLEEIEKKRFGTSIQRLKFLIDEKLVQSAALGICKKCIQGELDLQKMSDKQKNVYKKYVLDQIQQMDDNS
jgi:hypothetical protein